MKKTIIILVILFLSIYINKTDMTKTVMNELEYKSSYYELVFDEELLTFRNFKLKLAIFTSYEYNITKVYIDYPESIKSEFIDKEYFSFNNSNFNIGLEKLKKEYENGLKIKHLYNEVDKDINETKISKIEMYTEDISINIFKEKYPQVKINQIIEKKF